MQWMTMFRKEVLENWANKKWLWVPLVMIIVTIMDPLSLYFLPEIIELSGGIPEGAVIDFPTPKPEEVIMTTIEQLNMFGVLIVAFITMGTIAGEKQSGVTEMILVKPIRYSSYISTKWFTFFLLILLSLTLGMTMNWYYVNLLFGDVSFTVLMQIIFFYTIWLVFVLTVSIFYNTLFKVPGLVVASTLITIIFMSVINMLLGHKLTMFPNQLSNHLAELIVTGTAPNELYGTSLIIIGLIIILLFAATFIFKRKEFV